MNVFVFDLLLPWLFVMCILPHVTRQYVSVDKLEDCAFILDEDEDGSSSIYEYATNILNGHISYSGPRPCITYDAINEAYLEARKRIVIDKPSSDVWNPDEVASVGELLLDITAQLAKAYGLSKEEIEKALPEIDTSKTFIREICPPYMAHVECKAGKYRRHDGLCNNVKHPTWGATNTPFQRVLMPTYADSLTQAKSGAYGNSLPMPRIVSRTMHQDENLHDHAGTVMIVAWGQFMDHDFTLTGTPLDSKNKNEPEECCNRPAHLKNPYCMEITVPEDDQYYNKYKVRCQDFVRAFPGIRPGCRLGSRVPFNTLTGVIDGNTIYGVTENFARHLRSGYDGTLRMNPVFDKYGLKELLPPKTDIPEEGCLRLNKSMYCFESGEIRVNEQLVLTCMHTLMAREHNRVAKELAELNPHWDDEILYQAS
ncbi:hypothetical protein M8J75_004112 [Diaphorina citri]|nr:hypothetical protein M8J75_004112 [Diaphorina citri]